MVEKATYTFEDGMELTGTVDQIATAATKMGRKVDFKKLGKGIPSGYYPSDSKGIVKISEMNDFHIKRALLKRAKDYYTDLYKKEDSNKQFIDKFLGLAEDRIITELFNELSKRK